MKLLVAFQFVLFGSCQFSRFYRYLSTTRNDRINPNFLEQNLEQPIVWKSPIEKLRSRNGIQNRPKLKNTKTHNNDHDKNFIIKLYLYRILCNNKRFSNILSQTKHFFLKLFVKNDLSPFLSNGQVGMCKIMVQT